jgi:hypothetical protein
MTGQTTFPMIYGSPRRDCALSVPINGISKIVWSVPLGLEMTEFFPRVLIWEGNPVACMHSSFGVFTKDGQFLFKRDKHNGSPAAIANGLLYHENRGTYLEAVDLKNQLVLEHGSFGAAPNGEFNVTLFWPREKDYIGCSFSPYYEEVIPTVVVRRGSYTERLGIWGNDYKGPSQLWPLAVPELNLLLVSVCNTVICTDIEQQEETGRFNIGVPKLMDWSASPKGDLCILGNDSNGKVVLGMSPAGELLWCLHIVGDTDEWALYQPPIQAGEGRIYALTNKRVLAIKDGKFLGQHEPNSGEVRHGSSLPDGSLLVTSGETLLHLGPDGRVLGRAALGAEILSPPVADAEGFVYITTKTHLVKLGP